MILMNVLMLMFACGDKSDDTASPDDTDLRETFREIGKTDPPENSSG